MKKLLERFTKKNYKKQIKKNLGLRKVIKRKSDKLYVKWKGYDNSFNIWIYKKRYCYIKMSYFSPYSRSKNKIEVKLDLPNYAKKPDLKNAIGVDTSQFAKKDDLGNLKSIN